MVSALTKATTQFILRTVCVAFTITACKCIIFHPILCLIAIEHDNWHIFHNETWLCKDGLFSSYSSVLRHKRLRPWVFDPVRLLRAVAAVEAISITDAILTCHLDLTESTFTYSTKYIHSFLFWIVFNNCTINWCKFYIISDVQGHWGDQRLSPADIGRDVGYTLDKSPKRCVCRY